MPEGPENPFDDEPSSAPLPQDDRLWRHPSEMGHQAVVAPRTSLSRRILGGVITGVGLGAALLGAVLLVAWLDDSPSTTTARTQPIEAHIMLMASSTTTQAPASPGWLGVSAADVAAGVQVVECDPGSPAAAKLQSGDVILAFNGTRITRLSQLVAVLKHSKAGSLAEISIERQGARQSVWVTLASRAD